MKHRIIMETEFGSHLYGLSTPNSDRDFKGIVLPTRDEILLGKSSFHLDESTGTKSERNGAGDIDRTFYSLQYFIQLACSGETVAIDMLHAGANNVLTVLEDDQELHTIWKFLVENRHKFYTKSMKSYIGYVRKQAAKYGIKGSRVGELEKIIEFIKGFDANTLVGGVIFPINVFGQWIEYKGNMYYEFAGSKFQDNLKLKYMLDTLEKIYANYGERSKQAKLNEGVDWKALSHALRAGYQARAIFTNGTFSYPLAETDYLLKVKSGHLDFTTEVEPELDRLVTEVTALSNASSFPDTVNIEYWNSFIAAQHMKVIKGYWGD